jgi:enoyl-CoA hydratase
MTALDGIELDRAIRAIVVTGTGRAFSSGADIAAFQRHMETGPTEAVVHFMRPGHQMTRRVESFPKPIIAAVNGLAFGGGCELVEATHIALAAEKASFSKAEINIGIIPTFGGTQRLPRNVGRKAAIELILTGRTFDAAEALRLGLINRIMSGSELLREAVALAEELAMKPPLTSALNCSFISTICYHRSSANLFSESEKMMPYLASLLFAFVLLGTASRSRAHAFLDHAEPGVGSRLQSSPGK